MCYFLSLHSARKKNLPFILSFPRRTTPPLYQFSPRPQTVNILPSSLSNSQTLFAPLEHDCSQPALATGQGPPGFQSTGHFTVLTLRHLAPQTPPSSCGFLPWSLSWSPLLPSSSICWYSQTFIPRPLFLLCTVSLGNFTHSHLPMC